MKGPLARLEGPDRRGLICPDLAGLDLRDEKILPAGGAAGETAQHGQLPHMGERVGHGSLEKLLGRSVQRRIGGQKGVESLERLKEAMLLVSPGERLRGVPAILPNGHTQRPLKEVAHVGQNLHGETASVVESGEVIGRAIESADSSISQGGQRVAQQFAFLIHTRNYSVLADD